MLLQTRILLTVIMLFLPLASVKSQQYSSEGTEFYVSFLIQKASNPNCDITFSSATNTTVTVENVSKSYRDTFAVLAGIPYTVKAPSDKCVAVNNDKIENSALHITAANPITVYSMNYVSYVADGALVFPKSACGSQYYVASYAPIAQTAPSKFVAVAFEDNTVLNITPTVNTRGGHAAGTAYTVTLNKGETYMESASGIQDLTGTYIVEINKKKFAVFSGAECVNVPNTSCPFCDVLMEQVLPVSALGKKYLLAPLATETVTPNYTYRVIAAYNNTNLSINGVLSNTLQKGDVLEVTNQNGPVSLEANQPFMVIQYAQGSTCVGIGDPAMVVIPSLEQFINRVSYATASYIQFTTHYTYILAKTAAIGTLKINGTAVPASNFNTFSVNPQYSYANIKLPAGNHLVECPSGFIMVAYGYGKDISYAYIGGSSFKNLSHTINITDPQCDSLTFTMENTGDTSLILSCDWDFGDSTTYSGLTVKKTYAVHGVYKVTNITTTTINPNPDTLYWALRTMGSPQAGFKVNDTAQCYTNNFFVYDDTTVFASGSAKKRISWVLSNVGNPSFDSARIVRQYGAAGTYTVKLIAEADNGCTSTKTQTLYVYPQTDIKVLFGDTVACFKNHEFKFQNNSTISSGSIAENKWLFTDGDASTLFSPPPKKFDTAGLYQVKLYIKTNNGCKDSTSAQLTVYPTVTPTFNAIDVCLGDTAYYTNTTTTTKNIVAGWYWGFDNGDSASTRHSKYLYNDPGTHTVALAAITTQGCTDTIVKPAITVVKPKPKARFSIVGMDSSGYYYKFLFTNNSAGADFYLWNFDNGEQSTDENPLHEYYKSGKYTTQLTATNNAGCEDSYDTVITLVLPIEVYIPNAFTPGGNNTLNPLFKIEGISNIKDFEMLIFDRWGELLFKSNNIEQGWDGTYKNAALPDGAYLYIINIITEGRTLSYSGPLTLLR